MRTPIFAANWKMNMTAERAHDFMEDIIPVSQKTAAEIIIFPPAVYLAQVGKNTLDTPIYAGCQNMCWEKCGAFTGEICADMVKDCNADYVLCGHSERRHFFGESAEMVTRKARAAQAAGLIPLICVGETKEERDAGETLEVLQKDVICSLSAVEPDPTLVIAYEPVWAIGTGINATPQDAEKAIAYLRQQVGELWGDELAMQIRILYGGSVKGDNIAAIMSCPNIDGALVGGASLKVDSFTSIIQNGVY